MTEPLSTRSSGNPYADLGMSNPDERLANARKRLALFSEARRSREEREAELEQLSPSPRHPDWDEEEAT